MAGARRIFFSPDKFKGTLSASAAAAAMRGGASRALELLEKDSSPELLELPLADGGEGSLSTLSSLEPSAAPMAIRLPGANGAPRPVAFLCNGDSAFFESARLLSLRFPANRRGSILERSSAGLAQWHDHACGLGASELYVFLGGTAVCDGGFGCFLALGFSFQDAAGAPIKSLREIHRAVRLLLPQARGRQPKSLHVLSDVTNPLVGPRGAPRLFAPQKGASPAEVERLEVALATLARLVLTFVPGVADPLPDGIGAGGGIALPFLALYPERTRLSSGTDFFLSRSGLRRLIRPGDIVITGEGRTDSGTLEGKLVDGVVRLCRAKGARCLIVSGSKSNEEELLRAGYPAVTLASPLGAVPKNASEAALLLASATQKALLAESGNFWAGPTEKE